MLHGKFKTVTSLLFSKHYIMHMSQDGFSLIWGILFGFFCFGLGFLFFFIVVRFFLSAFVF